MKLINSILSYFRQVLGLNRSIEEPSKPTLENIITMESTLTVYLDRKTLYFHHPTPEPFEGLLEWWYMHTSVPYYVLNKENITVVLERSSIKAIILKRE